MSSFEEAEKRIRSLLERLHSVCDSVLTRFGRGEVRRQDDVESEVILAEHLRNRIVMEVLLFIAGRHPLGKDLIFAESALSASYDLFRVVRYVRENAALAEALEGEELLDERVRFATERVAEMLRMAMRGLLEGDVEAARRAIEMDKEIDELYFSNVRKTARATSVQPSEALRLVVLRHLERIADHATYVARAALELHGP